MASVSRSFNLDDPTEQEKIRRGPHEYIATAGKHGAYIPKPYKHQEYPKMMYSAPRPNLNDFKKQNGVLVSTDMALANWQAAVADWDQACMASIVNNSSEEAQWKRQNAPSKPAKTASPEQ